MTPNEQEWKILFDMSKKQAVAGIAFAALDTLSKSGQKPPLNILYQWLSISEQIKAQNELVNKRCQEITTLFAEAGFQSCILKGQGNARMYESREPRVESREGQETGMDLGLYRQSGDIDIWIRGTREEIKAFVVSKVPDAQDGDLHIDFPIFKDVPVEVHYKPRYSAIPKYDKRLQAWFKEYADEQFSHDVSLSETSEEKVCVPTVNFNVIQQMSHLMGHFFVEGIGLRQFLDYYFVLMHLQKEGYTEDYNHLFDYLGLLKFARGVMWIEKELLGLEDKYLVVEPSEKIGRLIQEEMEEGGNFGHYDERYNTLRNKGLLARGSADVYRLLHLATTFPSETFWKILHKIENQRWKVKAAVASRKKGKKSRVESRE